MLVRFMLLPVEPHDVPQTVSLHCHFLPRVNEIVVGNFGESGLRQRAVVLSVYHQLSSKPGEASQIVTISLKPVPETEPNPHRA